MRFGVLGPLAVWTADGAAVRVPDAKVRALLGLLLAAEGRPVSADRLIDDLWGSRLPRDPAATLQSRVSNLRKALDQAEPGARSLLVSQPPGYLLRAESVDAADFAALVETARRAADPRERAELLGRALDLWRGDPYADVPVSAPHLEEQRLVALEDRAEALLAAGEPVELGDLVARHPLRERLRGLHLRALYRAGRQSAALQSYSDLRVRLAEELGLDPGPELVALHEAILRHDPALGGPAARRRTNLPAAVTGLIGREDAVTHVGDLTRSARMVTLTGVGGVGKTQLALHVAREHPRDAWLVELSGLSRDSGNTPAAVAGLIASTLGIRDDEGTPLVLSDALGGRELLLVLDNCEHVVESVAAVAADLLAAAPGVRLLATSREPLDITGEVLWTVPPLPLPDHARDVLEELRRSPAVGPFDELLRSPAVELFVARAEAAAPGFALTADNAEDVVAICRRLDGIPLALELAAARVRVLGVRELAVRLDDRFGLLVTGRRGAPARQRTLAAMLDWSWDLLSDAERVTLRRLAIHPDGCALPAAEAIACPDGLDVLGRLVDRSLVVVTDGPRYHLLESVREYGLRRLRESGEYDKVALQHLRHHAELAERAEPHLRGPSQRRWLETLDREWANLRAALDTAVRLGEGAHRLVGALGWYWFLRGRLTEALRAFDLALESGHDPRTAAWRDAVHLLLSDCGGPSEEPGYLAAIPDPGEQSRARWFLAYARHGFTDLAVTSGSLARALEEFRALDDRWGTAAALSLRATIRRARGDLDGARRDAGESEELFRALGDRWGLVKATNTLAELAEIAGDYARAARLHGEGLRVAEELSLWSEASFRRSGLGRIALLNGELDAADAHHTAARRLAVGQSNRVAEHFAVVGLALAARRRGAPERAEALLGEWVGWLRGVAGEPGLALVLSELGFAAEQRGDADRALRLHREALTSARTIGDPRAVALALEGIAGALAHTPTTTAPAATTTAPDGVADAARLLGAAAALRESVGAPLPPAERGDVDRITAALRVALGDALFTTAFTEGTHLTPDEALPPAGAAPGQG